MIDHARARAMATEAIDFTLVEAERLELAGHRADCDACRRFEEALRRDASLLAGLPDAGPPWRVWIRLEAAIETDRSARRLTPAMVLLVALLLLAAAAASFAVGTWLNRPNEIHLPGLAWRPLLTEEIESAPRDLYAGSQGYVLPAIGTLGQPNTWFSVDGEAWQRATFQGLPAGELGSAFGLGPVFEAGGRLLAFAYSEAAPQTRIWESLDGGRAWAPVAGASGLAGSASGSVYDVTAFRNGYVAVGSSSAGAAVWTSPDGVTWAPVASSTIGEGSLNGVTTNAACRPACGSDERLFAVGETSGVLRATFWTSVDGLSWERINEETVGSSAWRVADTPHGLVAVGHRNDAADSPAGAIWISTDGITWQSVQLDPATATWNINAIATFGDEVLLGGGSGFIVRSADLQTWVVRQFPALNVRTVLYDPALQVAGEQPVLLVAGAETIMRGDTSVIRFYIGRLTLE